MAKLLSADAVARFERDGYYFPVRVMTAARARHYRDRLEAYEAESGGPIQSNMRHKVHLLFTWANELVRHPRILDAVEGPDRARHHLLGHQLLHQGGERPGLRVVASGFDLLGPRAAGRGDGVAGFHRCAGRERGDEVHPRQPQVGPGAAPGHLPRAQPVERGQEMAIEVDESQAVLVPAEAGEISLHHIRLAHASAPNTTADRRIAFSIRYIPPHVRQLKVRDTAMLVRGTDPHGHHDPEPDPHADLDAAARVAHARAMEAQVAALYQGTDKTAFRA